MVLSRRRQAKGVRGDGQQYQENAKRKDYGHLHCCYLKIGTNNNNGANDAALDNFVRFVSAVWIGAGLVLYHSTRDFARYWPVLCTMLYSIALGGLGRIYSIATIGWTPSPAGQVLHCVAIVVECIACPGIALYLTNAYGGVAEEQYKKKIQ